MNVTSTDTTRGLRLAVYAILIGTVVAVTAGRIMAVRSADRRTPFLSANDRSRWCTIRALVDHGTFAIDDVRVIRGWDSIDRVAHTGRDGEMHFYSSKPPLLPTMLAGQYWCLRQLSGASLRDSPFYIVRVMLILTNVVPMALFFALVASFAEKWGKTDVGRIFVVACATWGTFLTTFSITINNHLPAAISVMIALWTWMRTWSSRNESQERRPSALDFSIVGLFAAFAAANELPALAFLVLIGAELFSRQPRLTLVAFVPAALLVIVAFFTTNYIAHESWLPPYAHREWYNYPGSYWQEGVRKGVDQGEPSRWVYAFNVLVGHHGILSLTPIWLLSVFGGIQLFGQSGDQKRRRLAAITLVLTIVCLAFYLMRPLIDRNYGGVTSGFRWMFWFTPMWLLAIIPAADTCSRRHSLKIVAVVMLIVSVFSANYASMNPWSHPWMYRYWEYLRYLP